MNEGMDQFERRLSGQPLRPVPAEWRAEILEAVDRALSVEHREPVCRRPSTLGSWLWALLWPHPAAWAGLAAVWVLILVVDFSNRDRSPAMAQNSAPPAPEIMAELKQHQRMLAELIGARESSDADEPKSAAPRPRSEQVGRLMA